MIVDKVDVIRSMANDYLPYEEVKSRDKGGTTLSYIDGYTVKANANRIFGQGNWSYNVTNYQVIQNTIGPVKQKDGSMKDRYDVAAYAIVRVEIRIHDKVSVFEDIGYGNGYSYQSMFDAHESAGKEAVTDAVKRAMSNLGNQFGLCLYDRNTEAVIPTTKNSVKVLFGKIKSVTSPNTYQKHVDYVKDIAGSYGYNGYEDLPETNVVCVSQIISYLWREYNSVYETDAYDLLYNENEA